MHIFIYVAGTLVVVLLMSVFACLIEIKHELIRIRMKVEWPPNPLLSALNSHDFSRHTMGDGEQ